MASAKNAREKRIAISVLGGICPTADLTTTRELPQITPTMRIGEYRNIYRKVQNICRIEESRTGYTIVNEIYRNYEKPLTSELIARRFGISVTELNRLLLIQVERNFEDFLNLVRVNRACELLVETDRTVLEIAMINTSD